ncbi:glycosyltransferase [Rossellomorea vietnamensis]|uniref:glycosyltransferase family 2 protein n=1 Tax=Rossellomorea vietnamensis TaxID=218284 RepID=UPI0009A871C9|nr:glycosyl transferase family 2 [Bacillus sp. DSM 27956]PRX75775.1 glycosyl transferase family 2 [Bacillus sp. V-88]WQI94227.1 glycosyltransferase [Rossellomorea vietnamensis]SLK23424.1 Glycosyl transferase family 2 [Bacillus sp. V-88]
MIIKVSVIIPVFNAEKYIAYCLDSLLSQTLYECEFIFVNDGSKDKCKEIIEEYQLLDQRVKLINQENQGVSIARNNGMKVAKGEYIGFVDADDYVGEDYFKTLYHAAIEGSHDLIISNCKSYCDGKVFITTYSFPKNQTLEEGMIKELISYFLKEDNCNSVWNKLYKHLVIKENNLEFPKQVALGEDGLFNLYFLSFSNKVKYINYTGYIYREVKGSATRNIQEKDYFQRAIDVYQYKYPASLQLQLDYQKVRTFKAIKLIKNVMSFIHLYYTPTKEVSFKKRYLYIKMMLSHPSVIESLPLFYSVYYPILSRYEKLFVKLINQRSTLGLYLATAYSRFRNK